MKKILVVLTFFFAAIGSIQAQNLSKNAIGLRLGSNDDNGIGIEATYQRAVSSDNRVEIDFGWRSDDDGGIDVDLYKLTGLYHWVFNIDGGLNWYVGPGASLSYVDTDIPDIPGVSSDDSDFFFFVAGTVGIEYKFDIPLHVSFDLRPEIGFDDATDDLEMDWGFGVRYLF